MLVPEIGWGVFGSAIVEVDNKAAADADVASSESLAVVGSGLLLVGGDGWASTANSKIMGIVILGFLVIFFKIGPREAS